MLDTSSDTGLEVKDMSSKRTLAGEIPCNQDYGWPVDSSLVDGIENPQHIPSRVGGADLAIDLAFVYPDAVFVREQGGEGTSLMRREADGAWYFVD
jgi:hypothetical protein